MEQNLSKKTRTESDLIGSREVPESEIGRASCRERV